MKKLMVVLSLAVFAAIAPAVRNTKAQEAKAKKAPSTKELRWHGTVERSSADKSTLDVRKGTITKTIYYDSSTKWTKEGKGMIEASDVKDGDDVICLGMANDKKEFVATRIDLRTPKVF